MKNKKVIKLIIFIVVLLLLGVIGTFYEKNEKVKSYMDKYLFFKEKYENEVPKILIELDNMTHIYSFKNNIITLKNNELVAYNKYGNKEYSIEIEISNPIFSASDNYLAIAENKGNKIYVISDENVLWQKNIEGEISNIKINSGGYLLVAASGTIYKQVIQTFDNKGKELFKNYISSTYIIDMDISPDNKYIALAEANCSGILIQSNIKIISIEKAKTEPMDSIVYTKTGTDGDLIIDLKYLGRNKLVVLYDNHIEEIEGENVNTLDYSQENVLFIDVNSRIIKVLNKDSQSVLQIILNDLKTIKDYNIKEPKEIYVSENVIALNHGNEISFYSNSGWLIKRYYAEQEINKIILCEGVAGIVYNEKIELVSL